MKPEGSLRRLRVPATCPCPKPDQSSPCPTSHFLKIHLNIIFPSSPQISTQKPCIHLSPSIPYVLLAPPISFFSILSPEQYWVRSRDQSPLTTLIFNPNNLCIALDLMLHSVHCSLDSLVYYLQREISAIC